MSSKREYCALFSHVPDLVLAMDEQGIILEANRTACERLGYSSHEILGKSVAELLAEPEFMEREFPILKEQGRHECEVILLTRDGTPIEALCSACIIEDEACRPLFAVASFRDITQLKQVQRELRAERDRYRAILKSSSDGILLLDEQQRIVEWSSALERITGFSKDEVKGRSLWEVLDWLKPEREGTTPTREAFRQAFSAMLAGGSSEFLTSPKPARIRTRDGRVHHIEVSASVIVLEEGTKIVDITGGCGEVPRLVPERRRMLLALVRDITERVEGEQLEERFRRLIELVPDPIVEIDLDLNMRYANRAALRTFGYSREDVSPTNVLDVVVPEEHANVGELLDRLLSGEALEPVELRLRTREGAELVGEVHCTPMYHEGKVETIVCVIRDITERKRYVEELIEAKEEAELYIDLMAHDINNLNAVAYGYLSLLAEDEHLSERQKKAVMRSLSSLEGISMLIANVEKLREIAHKRRELVPMDLDEVVQKALLNFSGIGDVSIQHEPSGARVLADELLEEVVSNLVGNAIKHGGKGVHVWIRAELGDGHVRLIVEDDGKGVSDDIKSVVFNRLKRGESSVHGKGLGLYIVSTLVEGYGGRVWVEDREGGGARFVVELKRA